MAKKERDFYEIVRERFLRQQFLLFRIHDGGFMKNGKMISVSRGTDFYGFSTDPWEKGRGCVVEAKIHKGMLFTQSLFDKLEQTQISRMNLVVSSTKAAAFVAAYDTDNDNIYVWSWRSPRPKIDDEPLWIMTEDRTYNGLTEYLSRVK